MTRAALFVIFYAFVGTIITMVGYRLTLEGPLSGPGEAQGADGTIYFVSVLLNTALVFAAAGVTAAWVYPLRRSFTMAAVASAGVAGLVGALMMVWFHGVSVEFPIVAAISALICAGLARFFRLFRMPESRE